jgi:hypothetical protein
MPRRHLLWDTWARFWFAPESARNLAAARIVIALQSLWIVLSRDFAGVSGAPVELWRGVSAADRWRYLLFPGHAALEHVLEVVAVAALVAVALGIWPRVTCLVAGLLLYHLAPLETIIWTPSPYERGLEVSILSLVVLSVAPCTDALSVAPRRPAHPTAPWEYNWPLVLIQLFVAQIYFFSGYSKLFRVGVSWISAENLRHWLLLFNQEDQVAVFHHLGAWLAAHPTLCFLTALGAVGFDLTFIAVLFWKRLRMVYLPMAVLLHAGILFSMNIAFLNFPQLLVFVNWDWLVQHHVEPLGPGREPRQSPQEEAGAQRGGAPRLQFREVREYGGPA